MSLPLRRPVPGLGPWPARPALPGPPGAANLARRAEDKECELNKVDARCSLNAERETNWVAAPAKGARKQNGAGGIPRRTRNCPRRYVCTIADLKSKCRAIFSAARANCEAAPPRAARGHHDHLRDAWQVIFPSSPRAACVSEGIRARRQRRAGRRRKKVRTPHRGTRARLSQHPGPAPIYFRPAGARVSRRCVCRPNILNGGLRGPGPARDPASITQ